MISPLALPQIRGTDIWGSGYYLAPRGSRKHNGVDFCCHKGALVTSVTEGVVTKIGYPYSPADKKKGHLRYVQVDDTLGNAVRYFYISPSVSVGDVVKVGKVLGIYQGLGEIYEGISEHTHFEVKDVNGEFIDPIGFLEEL